MIAEMVLGLAVATSSSTARAWQVEAAGWERLALECGAELDSARGQAVQLRAQLAGIQARPALAAVRTPPAWRPALLGGMAGAAIAGGAAAGLACDEARCRGAGIAVGAVALIAAAVMLLSL